MFEKPEKQLPRPYRPKTSLRPSFLRSRNPRQPRWSSVDLSITESSHKKLPFERSSTSFYRTSRRCFLDPSTLSPWARDLRLITNGSATDINEIDATEWFQWHCKHWCCIKVQKQLVHSEEPACRLTCNFWRKSLRRILTSEINYPLYKVLWLKVYFSVSELYHSVAY